MRLLCWHQVEIANEWQCWWPRRVAFWPSTNFSKLEHAYSYQSSYKSVKCQRHPEGIRTLAESESRKTAAYIHISRLRPNTVKCHHGCSLSTPKIQLSMDSLILQLYVHLLDKLLVAGCTSASYLPCAYCATTRSPRTAQVYHLPGAKTEPNGIFCYSHE
jgi:hypothetical protein